MKIRSYTATDDRRSQRLAHVSTNASPVKPGAMPLQKNDEPPAAHARSSRPSTSTGRAGGYTRIGIVDVTTFRPAASMRHISSITSFWSRPKSVAKYATQSASTERNSSKSSVARTPTGATPTISPASRPTFSGECTRCATSSNSGRAMSARSAWLPVSPVP